MRSKLGKNFSRNFEIFFLFFFSKKIGFDTACKLSPLETICMKCQSLFLGEKMRQISMSLLLNLPRVIKFKQNLMAILL